MIIQNILMIIGLTLDIIGVIYLALPIFKDENRIKEERSTLWGFNPHTKKNIIYDINNAKSGIIFIIMGFIMQIVGYLFFS
ncbi:hypothetical protein COY27_04960 [Candidatus Woesearchaeota archaeon CG_4_10_14_0_2_um_filter_33_13]|nr:MAG: hypothetical protein COY27_04960 [Candidatus Woesearchaeota archaeon CG_4_10_14_0_2_um_filter_33_13]